MKRINDVYQIDAFTSTPFQGNSAAVVLSEDLVTEEMQMIAREMNLSETAFISLSDKADYNLRWFTPTVEVKLCGHATVASLHFLTERRMIKNNSEVKFETLSGIINCRSQDGIYYMQLPVPLLKQFKGDKNEIINALGCSDNAISKENPFIVTDDMYLYIYFNSLEDVKSLEPDFRKLYKLAETNRQFENVTVFTTETSEKNNSAHLRFFAPYYGIDEDPVTGSANGPLLMVMIKLGLIDSNSEDKIFTFEQGDVMGRKGRIKVSYSTAKNKLLIAGNAVTVFRGELNF